MYLSDAGSRTVASDLDAMFSGVDNALLDTVRLSVSVLETKATSTLPPVVFQKVLDSMANGFSKIIDGRKSMVSMHRHLATIKGQSNLAEVDYGCFFATGSAADGAEDVPGEREMASA